MQVRVGMLVVLALVLIAFAGCVGGGDEVGPAEETEGAQDDGPLELSKVGADEATLIGQVVTDGLERLEGATVVIQELKQNTTTNGNGQYKFEGLEPGTYTVFSQAPGFKVSRQSAELVGGKVQEANFILERLPSETPHITVLEQVGFLECQTPMFVVTMNCVPIQNILNDLGTNPTNTKQILKWEIPTEGLEAIVLEMLWNPSLGETAQDLGLWFETDSADVIEGESYGFAHGFTPVRIDVTQDNFTDLVNSNATTFQTRTFPVGGMFGAPGPDRIVFQQRFTVFVSLFYYQLPTPNYTGVPDGFSP